MKIERKNNRIEGKRGIDDKGMSKRERGKYLGKNKVKEEENNAKREIIRKERVENKERS